MENYRLSRYVATYFRQISNFKIFKQLRILFNFFLYNKFQTAYPNSYRKDLKFGKTLLDLSISVWWYIFLRFG